MTDVLDRVRKLIALTENPSREEARNAAAIACELIRKHGLEVVHKRPAGSDARSNPAEYVRRTEQEAWEEMLRRAAEQARYQGAPDGDYWEARAEGRKAWEREQAEARQRSEEARKHPRGDTTTAPFGHVCRECGGVLVPGEIVCWRSEPLPLGFPGSRETVYWHVNCPKVHP